MLCSDNFECSHIPACSHDGPFPVGHLPVGHLPGPFPVGHLPVEHLPVGHLSSACVYGIPSLCKCPDSRWSLSSNRLTVAMEAIRRRCVGTLVWQTLYTAQPWNALPPTCLWWPGLSSRGTPDTPTSLAGTVLWTLDPHIRRSRAMTPHSTWSSGVVINCFGHHCYHCLYSQWCSSQKKVSTVNAPWVCET